MVRACFSTEAGKESNSGSEAVGSLCQEILESIEKVKTMPPNAKLWSLVDSCSTHDHIELLFQVLQKLRIFRLYKLRIQANFNDHLCMRVTEACARSNAPEYGLKALWKHNVYGLTPTIGSAHYLLLHAKKKSDVILLEKIMDVIEKNNLPLQPGTADIVFSICYKAKKWSLITKYSTKFVEAGVKLHRGAYDTWMEFAAKRGDAKSIWKIEALRSKSVKKQTLASGLSCAKGYLIERDPQSAAAAINRLYQDLPDQKKPLIADELQKLVVNWTKQVLRRRKKEDREALIDALKCDIPAMAASLSNMGINARLNMQEMQC